MSQILFIFLLSLGYARCSVSQENVDSDIVRHSTDTSPQQNILVGAASLNEYLPLLKDKRVAGVFNQSSLVGKKHVVDILLDNEVNLQQIFTLEHGFRGDADAGQNIKSDIDEKTGLPLISLYGKSKKPDPEDLKEVDVIVFDVQDVGVRFYTYISTLHYVMESAAEQNVSVIILDRPNPNGHYIDGPVLDTAFRSFVGMHPVPVVHGLTIGEYAQMINGEKWLKAGVQCELVVIPCRNYSKGDFYELPVKPSPNLPNARSILLYPSLCFFEGTSVSIGRGTKKQFQVVGHPDLKNQTYSFTPHPMPGAKHPKHEGVTCFGVDLSEMNVDELHFREQIDLSILIEMYTEVSDQGAKFFTRPDFFDKLAGSSKLRLQIQKNVNEEEIRNSWGEELQEFRKMRSKYLLY